MKFNACQDTLNGIQACHVYTDKDCSLAWQTVSQLKLVFMLGKLHMILGWALHVCVLTIQTLAPEDFQNHLVFTISQPEPDRHLIFFSKI